MVDNTVAFAGGSDVLSFAIRLSGNTFNLGLTPPLFGDTASTVALQSPTANYVTFSAGGTPFDVGVVPLHTVPEPATCALMGMTLGALMLSRRRWLGA